MAEACPPIKSDQWKRFESIVGEDGAYRMWMENGSNDEALDIMERLLDINATPISTKIERVEEFMKEVRAIRGTDPNTGDRLHGYETKAGKKLSSVSEILDRNDDTKYQGDPVGSVYADIGTDVHRIFEDKINLPKGSSEMNIEEFMKNKEIPSNALPQIKKMVSELSKEGVLHAEVTLADPAHGYAGTTDIVRYRFDGGIDIIDIKTGHKTSKTQGKIWDPINHYGGYKARRYPSQIEFYKRLVERATGQSVKNAYIIPIEISYIEDSPAKGMEKITVLPMEIVNGEKGYGYDRRAKEIVDVYTELTPQVDTTTLVAVDDSTDFMEAITGTVENKRVGLEEQAERIRLNAWERKGVKYYKGGNEEFPLIGNDPAKHRQQIIKDYLGRKDHAQRNMIESVLNYMNTGQDRFLNDPGEHNAKIAENIRDWLSIYNKDVKITELKKIKGFENKDGWILFQQGEAIDLLYVGAEELDQRITMNGSSILTNRENLFGDYMTNAQARQFLGSELKNTRGDAKKLEGALIIMALKASIKEATFERAFVYSSYDNRANAPQEIQLGEMLPILQKLKDRKEFKDIIPSRMREIFADEESFNPENYRQNYMKAWQDYIEVNQLQKERSILNDEVTQYVTNRDNMFSLENKLGQTISSLKSKRDPKLAQELYLLSQMFFELRGVNTSTNALDVFRKITSMPTNVRNAVIADIVYETNRSLNKFKENYWDGYKKPSEKILNDLFKSSGFASQASNIIMADTTRMYNPMMEKQSLTDSSGKTTELPNFSLVKEDSAEFQQLTPPQKAFIKFFNDSVQDAAKKAGMPWVRGRIPLIKKSAMRQIGEAIKGNLSRGRIADIVNNSFKENFVFTNDTITNDPEHGKVINTFHNQSNNEFSDPRMRLLGISEDGNVNMLKYDGFETNLEIILDLFMVNGNKVASMSKSGWIFDAANALFEYQKANFFNESLGDNIDWVEVWEGGNLNNKDRRPRKEYEKKLMRVIKPANAVASLGIIGFSLTTAIPATIGQEFTLISKAFGNSFSDKGAFDLKAWGKSLPVVLNPLNRKKIDMIMQQYKLFDLDVNSLQSSQRRFIDKGIFNTKNAYMFLRAGDWATRAQAIVAQMIHDGTWNAYTLVDGKLEYNELMDDRFNGTGRYTVAEGKAIKDAIKLELLKEGHLSEDGKMLRAYDDRLAQKHKHIADTTFGGMDKETRGFWNYIWQGKLLGIFRSWLPARIDAMTKKPGTSLFDGDYVLTKTPDGEIHANWEGAYVEGYMYSLGAAWFNIINYLKRNETKPLNKAQIGNLRRIQADLMMMSLGYLAAAAISEAIDDSDLDEQTAHLLTKSLQDVAITYNLIGEGMNLFELPVSLNYTLRLWRVLTKITTGMEDGDKVFEEMLKATPLKPTYEIMNEIIS